MAEHAGTEDPAYTAWLAASQLRPPAWKRIVDVQAPYRWNIQRLLGGRDVLDVGCGVGRNLVHLKGRGVGVDHNEHSVRICRQRGLVAFTTAEFPETEYAMPDRFEGLLAAHLIEHMDRPAAVGVLSGYLSHVAPGGRVVLICPQARGYRRDGTHVQYTDLDGLSEIAGQLGLSSVKRMSFPLPAITGSVFTYNEFVLVATKGG